MKVASGIRIHFFACLFMFSSSVNSRDFLSATDYIRSLDEVVADSEAIYKLRVTGAVVGDCQIQGATGLVEYTAETRRVLRGKIEENASLRFCGYAGITVNQSYLLAFDAVENKLLFVSPDAVYQEHMSGEYFRLLSYESMKYTVDGKEALVRGFHEPDLEQRMRAIIFSESPNR